MTISTAKPETVPHTTTHVWLPGNEAYRDTNAQMQIVDGALVVAGDNGTTLYAPGQWLRAFTRRNHG